MGARHVVAVVNQKGGVGKTTVTLGLASAAAAAGRRVLVVDLDPQAASTWVLGIDPDAVGLSSGDVLRKAPIDDAIVPSGWSDGVDVVPARPDLQGLESGKATRLRRAFRSAALDRYDVVLVDCPPSLGNLTMNALAAARHAVVIVEPSALGLRGIGGVADLIDEIWDDHNPDLELSGVILNRVPASSAEADRRVAELRHIVGSDAIWSPPVPQRVVFNRAVGERRPIHAYGTAAIGPRLVFDALWARLSTAIAG